MKRRLGLVIILMLTAAVALVVAPASARQARGISVVPVSGESIGHGLKMWVFVYHARGGHPGPPGGGGGGTVNCTDNNSQGGYAAPFASARALGFKVNEATVPAGLNVDSALNTAAGQWDGAGASLTIASGGEATAPVQDGENTIGWARLTPPRVLAATWAYTDDATGKIVEADIFFNTRHPWATLTSCPSQATGDYDVADIGTHEMGHALGLSHFSDGGAQATMYPSAPSDEVRKVSLTDGDIAALQVALTP